MSRRRLAVSPALERQGPARNAGLSWFSSVLSPAGHAYPGQHHDLGPVLLGTEESNLHDVSVSRSRAGRVARITPVPIECAARDSNPDPED